MGSTSDKLYRVKTKEGAHINTKTKEDGTRAAIQFDEKNDLQGPVDLIEVDASEYTKEVYVEVERKQRGVGQIILEDAIVPALVDAMENVIERAIDSGFRAVENVMTQKLIPAAKKKGRQIVEKAKESHNKKELKPTDVSKELKTQKSTDLKCKSRQNTNKKVYHSQEEVDQIMKNMHFAAMYIAAGINELSNTIVIADKEDPKQIKEIQQKLNELSSEDVLTTINFMLEEKNRDKLDLATQRIFEAFRNKELIIKGESIPIGMILPTEEQSQGM